MSRKSDKELIEILLKQAKELGGITENTRNITKNTGEIVNKITAVDAKFDNLFKTYAGFSTTMKETSDSLKSLNNKIGFYTKLTLAMVILLLGLFIELLIVIATRIQL